jgi:phage FluMu protein Com
MQIRCSQCHKPFALGKEGVNTALETITAEDLSYYTISCPHCRRSNKVTREELLRAAPGWTPAETKAPAEQSDT